MNLFKLVATAMDENEIKAVSGSRAAKIIPIALHHLTCINSIPGNNLCKGAIRQIAKVYDTDPADPSWAILEFAIIQNIVSIAYQKAKLDLMANLNVSEVKSEPMPENETIIKAPNSNLKL